MNGDCPAISRYKKSAAAASVPRAVVQTGPTLV
jgi:hypothetical protein